MLNYVLKKHKVAGTINSTFLSLIPKEVNPANFSHFQPISLCKYSYNILTKIVANRIKTFLSKLISYYQGGFIANKQITYNIVVVKEEIHSSQRSKDRGMVIKLDMVNAFDRVKHSFL